ncbi:MAG: hypothetical protein LBE47_01940 [Methanomassiliicoccaceae archaeon]|jgi:hypothetical protein|nr:hypothetical protein [Methanomassiliicoccaceae archaeon]
MTVNIGSDPITEATENLKKLITKVNTKKMREPSFLAVVTATDHAYRRSDGVYVVPIGCLRE